MQHDTTFTLTIDGQQISVRYYPNRFFGNYDHFEFISPHQPAKPIPVSNTGYKSHFAPNHEVASASSPEIYAHTLAMLWLKGERPADPDQFNLF